MAACGSGRSFHVCKQQKQSPEVLFEKWCSFKFPQCHRKTPVLESPLNKSARLRVCNFIKRFQQRTQVFSVRFSKFLGTLILKNICGEDDKVAGLETKDSQCKKASQKLNALSRVAYQLDFNQRKLLMNAFITSQFSYAPVVWMFHSRKQNHHINRIHERALRVVYKSYNSSKTGNRNFQGKNEFKSRNNERGI